MHSGPIQKRALTQFSDPSVFKDSIFYTKLTLASFLLLVSKAPMNCVLRCSVLQNSIHSVLPVSNSLGSYLGRCMGGKSTAYSELPSKRAHPPAQCTVAILQRSEFHCSAVQLTKGSTKSFPIVLPYFPRARDVTPCNVVRCVVRNYARVVQITNIPASNTKIINQLSK